MKQIVPNALCLTPDQILRYLQDETSPVETRAIDRHLEQCPMCSDALEGAMQLPTADLAETFSNIQTKISDKNTIKTLDTPIMQVIHRSPKRYWLMGAAASVALLAVAGFWFFQNKTAESKSVVATDISVEKSVAPLVLDTAGNITMGNSANLAVVDDEKGSKIVDKPNALPKVAKPSVTVDETTSNTFKTTEMPPNTVASAPPAEYSMVKKMPVPSTEKVDMDDKSEKNNQTLAIAREPEAKMKESTADTELQHSFDISNNPQLRDFEKKKNGDIVAAGSAGTAPAQNSYPGAATQNANVPELNRSVGGSYPMANKAKAVQKPLPVQSPLVSGINFYNNKKYDLAIGDFNRTLAQEKTGDNYETALWYLANAYLKKGDKITARKLLSRIIDEKGKFAAQAEVLLKE